MAKIIPVSFKKGEEDLHIYVLEHSDKSCFIKECIKFFQDSKGLKKATTITSGSGERGKNALDIANMLKF